MATGEEVGTDKSIPAYNSALVGQALTRALPKRSLGRYPRGPHHLPLPPQLLGVSACRHPGRQECPPYSRRSSYNYHKTSTQFARFTGAFFYKNMILLPQGDTPLQLMTVCSTFAIAGFIGQRLWRLFSQKRRFRRPFHIWFVH